MHVDFLDIGTCDFEIGNGPIVKDKLYILVEPVLTYLNNIPNQPNITKLNYAISDIEADLNVFYIDEEKINTYSLPYWVRGCNKINEKHPTVLNLLKQQNITEDIFTLEKIKSITFKTLIQNYNITSITNLKIDTEGHDHIILKTVIDCLKEELITIENIKVEYIPAFKNTLEIDKLRQSIINLYPVQLIEGDNLFLQK